MDLWSSALVSVVLIASAVGLMVWHVRAWHAAQSASPDQREIKYRYGQYRRRMQTSAMLGLLGVLIFIGQLAMVWIDSRLFAVIFWGGVLLLLLWMGLLAVADMVATQQHFSRLRTDYLVERARLQAEARRLQAGTNGKAPKQESPARDEN
jgi:hypothetical protein